MFKYWMTSQLSIYTVCHFEIDVKIHNFQMELPIEINGFHQYSEKDIFGISIFFYWPILLILIKQIR